MLSPTAQIRGSLASAGVGLLLTGVAAYELREHLHRRYPFAVWSTAETVCWSFAIFSCVSLVLSGPWLNWRLPNNYTGWWITGAGIGLAGWILSAYSFQRGSSWMEALLPSVFKASIVVAVASWPTGRLPQRWATPLAWTMVAYVVIGVGTQFIGYPIGHAFRDQPFPIPTVGDIATGQLAKGFTLALLSGFAPAVLLAAVSRLRAGMPTEVRSTSGPAFVAAGLLGISELGLFAIGASSVPGLGNGGLGGRETLLGRFGFCLDYGRYGVIALLLVWSEAMRRRSRAGFSTHPNSIELGASRSVRDASGEVAHILGDPSARLILRGSTDPGAEKEASTSFGARRQPGRSSIEISSRTGVIVAVIEHNETVAASAATRDALMASVGLTVIHHARQEDARMRTAEVMRVQRSVLDAQDRARRRLERNLHDGVQQRLVALAIDASLLARREASGRGTKEDRSVLRESIKETIRFCQDLLRDGAPGVLDPGLAAGLVALAATTPLTSELDIIGDVLVDRPEAAALWFVASEAVANSLKHADARQISLRLRVDGHSADLTITDDGRGGVATPPAAIVHRLAAFTSEIDLTSRPGRGTSVHVRLPLANSDAAT